MIERFELQVEAKVEHLARISEFIADALRAFGLDDRKSFELHLAVDEACANIMHYAYSEAGARLSSAASAGTARCGSLSRIRGSHSTPPQFHHRTLTRM